MKRAGPAVLAAWGTAVVAGCGGGTTAVSSSASSPTPSLSPTISATPTPVVLPSDCRLPIAGQGVGHQSGVNDRFLAAFLDVAHGTETVDPTGEMVGSRGSDYRWHTVASPMLYGATAEATYDAPARRWVPVAPRRLSPDGSRYAYPELVLGANGPPTVRIHVVIVASASDRVILSGNYDVLRFTDQGVYLVHHVPQSDSSDGLWLMNPDTGAVTQVRQSETRVSWDWLGDGAAWAGALDPADPNPPSAKFPADELLRLDLRDRTVTTWFKQPGTQASVVGFDTHGNPIVEGDASDHNTVLLVTGPTQGTELRRTQNTPGAFPVNVNSSYTGRYGAWLTTTLNDYYLVSDSGLRVFSAPGSINVNVNVAGDCVNP